MEVKFEALIGGLVLPDALHWDHETQNLYFVDTNDRSIYRYTPSTKIYAKATLGLNNITVIIPLQGQRDKFLITHGNKLSVISWDGKSDRVSSIEPVAALDGAADGSYIWCDGKVDPRGKFWAGAMIVGSRGGFAEKTGTLYNLETDKRIKRHFNSLTIPNGLAWNQVTKKFYFIDSPTRRIEEFDYDAENSIITNRTRLFTFDDHDIPGAPDGMTIDIEGNLWVTCFGGGMVIKIDPTKRESLLEQIRLPAGQANSYCILQNLCTVILTTAETMLKIECINDDRTQLGESPFWDENSQSIYFVDIYGKSVYHYTPATKRYVKAVIGEKRVSFIIPIEDKENKFLIGYGNELAILSWDGVSNKIEGLETVVALQNTDDKNHVFNDGKADPWGRIWAGIYLLKPSGGLDVKENQGTLFALKSDKTLGVLTSGVTLSNGLTWNDDLKKFYYIDTMAGEVYQFDYKDSQISNQRTIFEFSEVGIDGGPDGMTIDSDGNLWIACFGGSKIIQIDPKKPNTLLKTIDMPVKQVTCVEFGGLNYEDLYVTTGSIPLGGTPAPEGGWTYKITGLGVRGVPARKVKL
ncbi:regucalcin [Holotrichia oblita]|uniref:Regucalcin n=1 Tax=Holotrichia oblita TaxID=644536 RepID=A0ACB9TGP0_HOLOL|nr:regucalcin [Holotrichia oblita]